MPTPLSDELLVNAFTAGDQLPTGSASLASGVTVITWLDGSSGSTVAKLRLVGSDGIPVSGEVAIGAASEIQVSELQGGGFVIGWITSLAAPGAVRAQLYDASGQSIGSVRDLTTYGVDNFPVVILHTLGLDVKGLSDGGFSIAWSEQRSDSMAFNSVTTRLIVGNAQGMVEADLSHQLGPSSKTMAPYDPQVTVVELPEGQLMLTWHEARPGVFLPGQFAQLYDLHGAALGSQLGLDPAIPHDGGPWVDGSGGISVAALASGDVAFAWQANGTVWVSLYPSDHLGQGILNGRTQPLALTDVAGPGEPQIAVLADGRFLVAWSADDSAMARIFSITGAPDGAAFRLGDTAEGVQDLIDVTARPDGAFVAVWRDNSHQGGDASGTGVKIQVLWPGDGQAGGSDHDVLIGGSEADVLAGHSGEDWLLGKGGADTLSGGPGPDKFILGSGVDRILDFQSGSDHLLLFDVQGRIPAGLHSLLIWSPESHTLSWDPDGDNGGTPVEMLAVLDGVDYLSRSDLAAGFQPSVLRLLLGGGAREEFVFDWSSEPFDVTDAVFNGRGDVVSYAVTYDDGTRTMTWLDDQATQAWSRRGAEYDSSGTVTRYTVVFDNGHVTDWTFDPDNQQAWSRSVDDYDASGRLLTRSVVGDDGAYWIATYDATEVQPWYAIVDHFDATGQLARHATVFDDGSVIG